MHVLFIALAYPPAFAFGGPVKVVQSNARQLVKSGVRTTVYCTNRLDKHTTMGNSLLLLDDAGVEVVFHPTAFLPGWKGSFGPTLTPSMIKSLWTNGKGFDVIHINEARTFTTLIATCYALLVRKPYVLQAHGSFTLGHRFRGVKRLFDALIGRFLYSHASAVIALTPSEVEECLAVGVPRDRIVVLGNGIGTSDWNLESEQGADFRKRHRLPDDKPVVLFLSRLEWKKGPDLLLHAIARLASQDVHCILAGSDDGMEEGLRKQVSELGLSEQVVFTGLLQGDELKAAFAAADVFVLPARYDTFPMAIVEALAAGLPVVTTETCQLSHVVAGRAGIVVSPDADKIAYGISELICNELLRKQYADTAKQIARDELSIEAVSQELLALYSSILGQPVQTEALTKR